jgi:hypothetical protein
MKEYAKFELGVRLRLQAIKESLFIQKKLEELDKKQAQPEKKAKKNE